MIRPSTPWTFHYLASAGDDTGPAWSTAEPRRCRYRVLSFFSISAVSSTASFFPERCSLLIPRPLPSPSSLQSAMLGRAPQPVLHCISQHLAIAHWGMCFVSTGSRVVLRMFLHPTQACLVAPALNKRHPSQSHHGSSPCSYRLQKKEFVRL